MTIKCKCGSTDFIHTFTRRLIEGTEDYEKVWESSECQKCFKTID